MKAAKIVASSLVGKDSADVLIGGKVYSIPPPTIKRIAEACVYIADMGDAQTISDILRYFVGLEGCAKALSIFIKGDESLSEELCDAPFDEVAGGLCMAIEMISAQNFLMLLASAKNVQMLIAKPK